MLTYLSISNIHYPLVLYAPLTVAASYKASVCARSLAGIAGSNIARAWISVCCESCVLSGRGLCDGTNPRPAESYRMWFVRM